MSQSNLSGPSVISNTFNIQTKGNSDVIDITDQVESILSRSGLANGIVTVFVVGSTAGITTIEFEPGLVNDIKEAFERVAPRTAEYEHHLRWGDDNGHSHVRASILGPSITVPFNNRRMALGTWQQIVLVDFDTRARKREIIVQSIGIN